jgi:hypothetical protein
MKFKNMRKAAPAAAAFVILAIAGFITFVMADEKQEIPDHSGFESCQPCHAEEHDMWQASNHGKAVRSIAYRNPAATDCSGCHSYEKSNDGRQNVMPDGVQNEAYHRISCLACHTRQENESDHRLVMDPAKLCETCHFQRSVFWGTGARGIQDVRNFHSGVLCVSCHMTEGNHNMRVIRPDDPGLTGDRQDTCTACHMDDNREARIEQIQEWQSMYGESMESLLEDVAFIEGVLREKPDLLSDSLKTKFDDVKYNLSILEKDGSKGFHNFVLSLEITSQAARSLKEIKAAINGK